MLRYDTPFLEKTITFIAIPHGNDFAISVMGGSKPHIGAVSVCAPGLPASLISIPGHKEGSIALALSEDISQALNCTVSVSVGIHYDNLLKSQIDDIIEIAMSMANSFILDISSCDSFKGDMDVL